MKPFVLPRSIFNEIVEHAHNESPRECCGLLGGNRRSAASLYRLRNQASNPEREYFAAPEDLFHALRDMRTRGERLVAIYHSHPRGEARPSATDLAMAFYPEAVYLIAALEPEMELRAFNLRYGKSIELKLQIVD